MKTPVQINPSPAANVNSQTGGHASKSAVKRILISELAIGNEIAENVHDISGRMLVSAGTEVTERHLRAFQMWGVTDVKVWTSAGEGKPEQQISQEDLERAATAADSIFQFAGRDHPVMAILFETCLQRITSGKFDGGITPA